jgi:hypothetical protein
MHSKADVSQGSLGKACNVAHIFEACQLKMSFYRCRSEVIG